MSRCKATIVNQTGEKVRCQIHGIKHNVHDVDGFFWSDGQKWPTCFRRDDLYLTSGGRIVKPGGGEIATEPGDIVIMTREELQNGLKFAEFMKRLNAAKRKWNKRKWNRGCKLR